MTVVYTETVLRQTWKLMSLHFFSGPNLIPNLLAAQSRQCCCVQVLWEFSFNANPVIFEFLTQTLNRSNWKILILQFYFDIETAAVILKYNPRLLQSPKMMSHTLVVKKNTMCAWIKCSSGPGSVVSVRQHFSILQDKLYPRQMQDKPMQMSL